MCVLPRYPGADYSEVVSACVRGLVVYPGSCWQEDGNLQVETTPPL